MIASKIKASLLSAVLVGSLAFSPLAFADEAVDQSAPAGTVTTSGEGNSPSVQAPSIETDDDTLKAEWTVTFIGTEMVSDGYATTQVLQNMQPGDTAEFTINLVNAYDGEVDWYVRNMIVDSMEQGNENNTGGAYEYELIDLPPNGEPNVLYSNTRVGGDSADAVAQMQSTPVAETSEVASDVQRASRTIAAAPTTGTDSDDEGADNTEDVVSPTDTEATEGGLLNVTEKSGMDEYFHLATMGANTTRQMKLVMGIDGETHTNGYFDTNAGALIQYAAEPVGSETITTVREGNTRVVTQNVVQPKQTYPIVGGGLPQTGDMLPTITMMCLALGLLLLICGVLSWINDRKEHQAVLAEGDAKGGDE